MKDARFQIRSVFAMEILDSRGNPTIEATVALEGGAVATAAVPSGASRGSYEACELRDEESPRYGGKGVLGAVGNVNGKIAPVLLGLDADNHRMIDETMCALDGTENKSALGANSILAVSLATVKAAAAQWGMPLWRYLGGSDATGVPVPMMNILNGGAHASNNVDVQEFMILPLGAPSFADGLRMGSEIYHALGRLLKKQGLSVGVGDEGGFAPDLPSTEAALALLSEAVAAAGYEKETVFALDAAASEWKTEGEYYLPKSRRSLSGKALIQEWQKLREAFPIYSIEDGLGENDFDLWHQLTEALPHTMLVGDDLFVTNASRLKRGIDAGAGNAILIKPNQIGTVSETADVIAQARANGYRVILSHRSGETEDTSIADMAVGFGADFIKSGAPCRSERVAKYNRLLAIEHELHRPKYAYIREGRSHFPAFHQKAPESKG